MAYFLWLFLALIPYLLGKCALRVLYGNQPEQGKSRTDNFLTGGTILIGLAEAAHLWAVLTGQSLFGCTVLFGGLTAAAFLCSAAVLLADRSRNIKAEKKSGKFQEAQKKRQVPGRVKMIYLLFAALVLYQVITIVAVGRISLQGDMTVETVNSFLAEDAMYQVNPMTGQAYELGIPLRLKILCLPSLYAMLCRISGLDAWTVVWTVVPVAVLAGSYCAYFGLAKSLFPHDAWKRGIFLTAAALVFCVGDYMYGMDGFGLLHGGFRGTAIRAGILLPYTFDLCIRKKWRLIFLCILAEACIVWTFYGLGACLFVAVLMFVFQKYFERKDGGTDREEGSKWGNF